MAGRLAVLIAICCLPALAADAGKTVSILDYGAVGDGKTLCTAAIQQAVDTCAAAGGGTVRVPKGTFLTGSIRLASRVAILLDEGTTLLGSPRIEAALVVCP
jgi:polygalacturonase